MERARRGGLRLAALLAAAALVPACGGGDGGGGGNGGAGDFTLDASGGSCFLPAGVSGKCMGGFGGGMIVYSSGSIRTGGDPAPLRPTLPPPPTNGLLLPSLPSDVTQAGDILLNGIVTSGSAQASYTITSTGGDIVINGTLIAGDPGVGAPASLNLSAVNGTVYVLGAIRTFNTDGQDDGDAGGNLTITAARIVVMGTIDTHGETNTTGHGGPGGSVTLDTASPAGTDVFLLDASLTTSGGAAAGALLHATGGYAGTIQAAAGGEIQILGGTLTAIGGISVSSGDQPRGGLGGGLDLQGSGGVTFQSTAVLDGGAATGTGAADGSQGGSGGSVSINTAIAAPTGPVRIFGLIRQRGADAHSVTALVERGDAGRSGDLMIGGSAVNSPLFVEFGAGPWLRPGGASPNSGGSGGVVSLLCTSGLPGSIDFTSPLDASGGPGGIASSSGGGLVFRTTRGDIRIGGAVTSDAGTTVSQDFGSASAGGAITIIAGDGTAQAAGSILIAAPITSKGAASSGSGSRPGGNGGAITVFANNGTGTLTLTADGSLASNGGSGTGTQPGGTGGTIQLRTRDERIRILGSVTAYGGAASTTGTGGAGGRVEIRSDDNNDDLAGSITIETGAMVDVSAGAGGTGGSARNSGAAIPTDALMAIVIAADGDPAFTGDDVGEGIIENKGLLRADGGASTASGQGGRGGQIVLSGRGPAGAVPAVGTTSTLPGSGSPAGIAGSVYTD